MNNKTAFVISRTSYTEKYGEEHWPVTVVTEKDKEYFNTVFKGVAETVLAQFTEAQDGQCAVNGPEYETNENGFYTSARISDEYEEDWEYIEMHEVIIS